MSVTTISIPHERRIQINEIAESFGTKTMTGTVGEMIRVLARHGIVTTTLPGIEINRASDGPQSSRTTASGPDFCFEHARAFVRRLRRNIESDKRLGDHLDMDAVSTSATISVAVDPPRLKTAREVTSRSSSSTTIILRRTGPLRPSQTRIPRAAIPSMPISDPKGGDMRNRFSLDERDAPEEHPVRITPNPGESA